jgi:hypothetical protein
MSLFHALIVFHLLALVGISFNPRGKYPMGSIRLLVFTVLHFIAMTSFLAFLIFLFATAPTYGSQPECNASTIYVIFGINIPAVSPIFRCILIASVALILVTLLLVMLTMSGILCCFATMGFFGSHMSRQGSLSESEEVGRIPLWRLIGHLGGCAYIIAMIELMIKRNNAASSGQQWAFGQVISMLMLVGPLIELLALILGRADARSTTQRSET